MGHIGFWQLLLDDKVSAWEANKINQASDQARDAQSVAGDAHIRVHALEERLSVQSREIVMLRTAVTVLTNTLRDCKILDERLRRDVTLDALGCAPWVTNVTICHVAPTATVASSASLPNILTSLCWPARQLAAIGSVI
jgi:hypothetical protein